MQSSRNKRAGIRGLRVRDHSTAGMAAMLADAFGHFNTHQSVVAAFRDTKMEERCRQPVPRRGADRLVSHLAVLSPLIAPHSAIDFHPRSTVFLSSLCCESIKDEVEDEAKHHHRYRVYYKSLPVQPRNGYRSANRD